MSPPTIGPCGWYESADNPKCGVPAIVEVTVKTKITTARVPLCSQHKAVHDSNFARARKSVRS